MREIVGYAILGMLSFGVLGLACYFVYATKQQRVLSALIAEKKRQMES